MDSPRKGLPGKPNSRCKGPEVGRSLRNGKGHVSEGSYQLRLEKLTAARSRKGFDGCGRSLVFLPRAKGRRQRKVIGSDLQFEKMVERIRASMG